ncbi:MULTISPECIES: hypothetical protein [unclassified Pseudoalteromonas]|uniref:hypothetical protein n=1 Tax=unclassified Pseudoalteromonas TaxID=194690 RepID=UPI0015F945AE|nr:MULTISPECIES: hypothetical protein [unclassified Pseudoalteromonas]MBB1290978.1 hypothetical protein [Pseudoalteromonas sp. SR41-5]MBB1415320.1 hypothetical protein [Pseudoalteromonas sp. SG43-8]
MRLNKLNLAIKLALGIKHPCQLTPLDFAVIDRVEKGIQIFLDEYGTHYESESVFDRLDEILNARSQKLVSSMGVPRKLFGECNA